MRDKFKLILRFYKYTMKYKKYQMIIMICIASNIAVAVVIPQINRMIIDNAIMKNDSRMLCILSLSFTLVVLFASLIEYALSSAKANMAGKVTFDIRSNLLAHLSRLSGNFYTSSNTGKLNSVALSDVSGVEQLATDMLLELLGDFFMAIVMFFVLLRFPIKLLIISLVFQIILFLAQSKFNSINYKNAVVARESYGKLASSIHEYLIKLMEIIYMNSQGFLFDRYKHSESNYINSIIKCKIDSTKNTAFTSTLNRLITVIIMLVGGYYVINHQLTIGELIIFTSYMQRFTGPIYGIIGKNSIIQQTLISVKNIFDVMDQEQMKSNSNKRKSILGNIAFENVEFSYDNETKILNNLNFKFKQGEIVGIVGKNGSGKSTIIKLIFRFWDVSSGKISIDGINIIDYDLTYIRKNISVISQDIFLLDDTILTNIVLDKTDISLEEVSNVTKMVGLFDLIDSMPQKINTQIGEQGIKLSGGQKQKIAIARAIISQAPIIIFDEATSSLDNISENYIKKLLVSLFKNRTLIIISHRFSILDICDNIFVLDEGKILESGTHIKLMRNKKIYYELYKTNGDEKIS